VPDCRAWRDARRGPAFAGYSLTIPLKVDVLPLLDDLEPLARSVGVVNTVVPAGGGRLVGANTDLPLHTGALAALAELGCSPVVALAGCPRGRTHAASSACPHLL